MSQRLIQTVQEWYASALVNAYTITASALTMREEITGWLGLVALLLGILGSSLTIINQYRKLRASMRRRKAP